MDDGDDDDVREGMKKKKREMDEDGDVRRQKINRKQKGRKGENGEEMKEGRKEGRKETAKTRGETKEQGGGGISTPSNDKAKRREGRNENETIFVIGQIMTRTIFANQIS
jgi:hypothetical protein